MEALQNTITRENLKTFVTMFYHKALDNEQIGHYFTLELGDDIENEEWARHISILVDFWSSVFINYPHYYSDPYGPHFTITDLKSEDFVVWIEIFLETAKEVYTQDIVEQFKEKAIFYSEDFISRLKLSTKNTNLTSIFW